MKVLAGLEVTTKSVERIAETIGADIAQREQTEIQKALQLHLPAIPGEPIPILYVQIDGTGVPMVKRKGLCITSKAERRGISNAGALQGFDLRNGVDAAARADGGAVERRGSACEVQALR